MKVLVLALSLASALGFGYFPEPVNTCISTCGMCYSSITPEMTCHTEYAGNCEGEPYEMWGGTYSTKYWYASADCNEEGAVCQATYSNYGRLCVEGGTLNEGESYETEFTALDADCCPFVSFHPSSAPTDTVPTTWSPWWWTPSPTTLTDAPSTPYPTPTPVPTPDWDTCTSRGACYDASYPAVFCDLAESDCYAGVGYHTDYDDDPQPGSGWNNDDLVNNYTTWYPPGSVSDYDGCCHCGCSCDHALETNTVDCYYGEEWTSGWWEPP